MKAIVYDKYGSPDVLRLSEVDTPIPKDDEVLIKIHAAAVNDWDWGLLIGDPVNRLLNGLFKPKKRKILGSDIAGTIETVGKQVTQFQPGDEVYGDLCMENFGGFAEYVCASENLLAQKPRAMTFEQAAAIPQAGMLAVQALRDTGNIKSGQKVLINGAGGGVGTLGIQIAKLHDVELTGVDNDGKLELMRSIGFDHVIDYQKEDFTRNGLQYDLIVDAKTSRSPIDYLRALKPNGTYVTVGGAIPRLLQMLIFLPIVKLFSNKRICIVSLKPNKDLDYINELFEAGKFKPVLDGPFTLEDVPKAMRLFGEGSYQGKIIIKMAA